MCRRLRQLLTASTTFFSAMQFSFSNPFVGKCQLVVSVALRPRLIKKRNLLAKLCRRIVYGGVVEPGIQKLNLHAALSRARRPTGTKLWPEQNIKAKISRTVRSSVTRWKGSVFPCKGLTGSILCIRTSVVHVRRISKQIQCKSDTQASPL